MKNIPSMCVHLGDNSTSVLRYADDLVLISKSGKGLQKDLSDPHKFSSD